MIGCPICRMRSDGIPAIAKCFCRSVYCCLQKHFASFYMSLRSMARIRQPSICRQSPGVSPSVRFASSSNSFLRNTLPTIVLGR